MLGSARALRRAARHAGPLVVCLAVTCAMLAPYAGDRLRESTASDLAVHCSGIIEATNALAEGQFPVRVAPSHNGGHGGTDFGGVRYPLFQFYGQFPYTAGGVLCRFAGVNAFTAWKLVQLAALTLGGFYVFRCGVAATRRPRASLVAGVVFMTAPYMWADLHARFAYPELVSFNLLPVVTFYAMRAFAGRRWGYVLLGGVAWSLLALSHNITFLYASALLGLYVASHFSLDRRFAWRIMRVGLGYGLGVVLTLWFHAPQLDAVPLLNIRLEGDRPRPIGAEQLTPLDVLLAPALESPPGSPTARLGLQVGWPALAAAGLALGGLFRRNARPRVATSGMARPGHFSDPGLPEAAPPTRLGAPHRRRVPHCRRGPRDRVAVARLLFFFGVAFLFTWSPPPVGGWDIWALVPRVFVYVQSSYRLLMFVTLFAALLVPHALATRRGRDLPAWATPLLLAAVAWAAVSYVPRHERLPADALARLVAHPILDGLRDYLIHPAEAARTSRQHPDVNWAEPIHGVVPRDGRVEGSWRSVIPVPPVWGGKLVVEGSTPPAPSPAVMLRVVLDGKPLEPFQSAQGEFRHELQFDRSSPPPPVAWIEVTANRATGEAGPATGDAGPATVVLRGLRFTGSMGEAAGAFVSAEAALQDTRRGARTTYAADLARPALVQLPVLYYPRLLGVRVDGKDSAYGNVGRFVALDLPAGRHEVEVEFVGVRWANRLSAAAWAAVLVALACLAVRRARRAVRSWAPPPQRLPRGPGHVPGRAASHGGLRGWEPAVAAVLLFAVIGAVPVSEAIRRSLYVPLDCTVTASRPGDELHPPAHAFDGDETTYWFAPGGSPATLTIVPRQAAKFRRITLLARRSGLWEAWHTVRVVFHLRGKVVFENRYHFADAATLPEQVIHFKRSRADRIELHFSEPVTLTRDGKTRVDPNACSPGYREIRVE